MSKKADKKQIKEFLKLIEKHKKDKRKYVKKAIKWALRKINSKYL